VRALVQLDRRCFKSSIGSAGMNSLACVWPVLIFDDRRQRMPASSPASRHHEGTDHHDDRRRRLSTAVRRTAHAGSGSPIGFAELLLMVRQTICRAELSQLEYGIVGRGRATTRTANAYR
jgi:hypothetical protein